jgi:hypothetical protein
MHPTSKSSSEHAPIVAVVMAVAAMVLGLAVSPVHAGPLEWLFAFGVNAFVACDQNTCVTSPVPGATLLQDLDTRADSIMPDLVPVNAVVAPVYVLNSVVAKGSVTATSAWIVSSADIVVSGSSMLSAQFFFFVTRNDLALAPAGSPRTLIEEGESTWTNVDTFQSFTRNRLQSISFNDPQNVPFGRGVFTTPFIEESPYSMNPTFPICTPFTGTLVSTCSHREQTQNIVEGNPFSLMQETLIELRGTTGAEVIFEATTTKSVPSPASALLLGVGLAGLGVVRHLRCGIGSCGVPRPSMAPYVAGTGAARG